MVKKVVEKADKSSKAKAGKAPANKADKKVSSKKASAAVGKTAATKKAAVKKQDEANAPAAGKAPARNKVTAAKKAVKAKKPAAKKSASRKKQNAPEAVVVGRADLDLSFLGSREETAESRNAASRERVRSELDTQVEAFLSSGGSITNVEPNVMGDPPRKPESNYGSRPI